MMKTKNIILVFAVISILALVACGTPIDKAVEWGEEQTDNLSDEIRGN